MVSAVVLENSVGAFAFSITHFVTVMIKDFCGLIKSYAVWLPLHFVDNLIYDNIYCRSDDTDSEKDSRTYGAKCYT